MTFIILNLHSMVFFCCTSFSSALFPLILWSCWDLFTVPMKFFRNIPEMSSLILTPPPHPPGNQLANKEEQQADNQLSDYQKAKGKKNKKRKLQWSMVIPLGVFVEGQVVHHWHQRNHSFSIFLHLFHHRCKNWKYHLILDWSFYKGTLLWLWGVQILTDEHSQYTEFSSKIIQAAGYKKKFLHH